MAQKCPFCGENTPVGADFCPNCGTRLDGKSGVTNAAAQPEAQQNPGKQRYAKPRTIEELKTFCREKGMPLYTMRFFLGVDYKEPRAFGIFQDADGDFVVYKNKDDGTRAIRYKGPDEAFAVNEIYEKIKSEKKKRATVQTRSVTRRRKKRRTGTLLTVLAVGTVLFTMAIILTAFLAIRGSFRDDAFRRGYYEYEDRDYYYNGRDEWYWYDPAYGDWTYYYDDVPFIEEPDDYYRSYSYDEDYGVTDFSDTDYYYEPSYDDDDDDDYYSSSDDYDWDSGYDSYDSWDSGDTDWSSDW